MSASLSQHEALVHVMVMMSAVDRNMTDDEIARIGVLVRFLPAFDGFDEDHLIHIGRECADQRIRNEEIRLLQLLRDRLGLDKLACAAIERGAIARFRK